MTYDPSRVKPMTYDHSRVKPMWLQNTFCPFVHSRIRFIISSVWETFASMILSNSKFEYFVKILLYMQIYIFVICLRIIWYLFSGILCRFTVPISNSGSIIGIAGRPLRQSDGQYEYSKLRNSDPVKPIHVRPMICSRNMVYNNSASK